jgi:ParB family chromosome partitioning protein
VPLIVRANGASDMFEIVAGRRRYFAACAVAKEKGSAEPLPCAVMEAGDDAAALEASLIENVARADPHEVEQWETFTRLVREGRSAEEIALVFGLTDRQVAQVLGLGNLLPKIRELYRREEIDGPSVRLLTMASKVKQKEWLALFANPETFTPTGHNLKSWLFGGASISTKMALFDLATYKGEIVADLFGEDGYFADARAFWEAQNEAIDMRRRGYLEAGWSEVVLLDPNSYFQSWEYEKTPRRKGGKVTSPATRAARSRSTKAISAARKRGGGRAAKAATSATTSPPAARSLRPFRPISTFTATPPSEPSLRTNRAWRSG